jgi:hypothetical protein
VGTEVIVARNLFDPERGAVKTEQVEADTQSVERVRSLVLLGAAIVGSTSYAILQEGSRPGGAPQARSAGTMRLKVGDGVEGFSLSEIGDKNVVFSKGVSKIELKLDYFRKVEVAGAPRVPASQPGLQAAAGQARPSTPMAPSVSPRLPRRERLPLPPNA